MSRTNERSGTWYGLIRASLEEDAAGTVLPPLQIQALVARRKVEYVFSACPPKGAGEEPDREKKQPPCLGRGDLRTEPYGE